MFQDEKKELGINHQFDIWNFVKNINKKLINASQKASCKILSKWVNQSGIICGGLVLQVSVMLSFYERNG